MYRENEGGNGSLFFVVVYMKCIVARYYVYIKYLCSHKKIHEIFVSVFGVVVVVVAMLIILYIYAYFTFFL